MEDIKKKYRTIMDDHFPRTMKITFGDQTSGVHEKILENPRVLG